MLTWHFESSISVTPKLYGFTVPLVSQQYFYGASRPKEVPNTSVYYVVSFKQFSNYSS